MKPEALTQVARWATAVVALVAFIISFISVGHVSSDSQLGWAGWGVPAIVEGGIVAVSCARIFAELRGKRGATWMLGIISVGYVALAVAFNLMHLAGTLSGVIVAVAAPVTLFIAAETFLWMTKVQMESPTDDKRRHKRIWSIIKRHRAVTKAVRVLSARNHDLTSENYLLVKDIEESQKEVDQANEIIEEMSNQIRKLSNDVNALLPFAKRCQRLDNLPPFTEPLLTAIANGELNDDKILTEFSEKHNVAVTSLKRTVSLFRSMS